ncbi:MAG: hypothetical protein R3C05_22785 [Pirellulaceae bacterium]
MISTCPRLTAGLLCVLLPWLVGETSPTLADGNRLVYLDAPCDPYYVHRDFPRLITPQWVGDEGVQAVVTLGIDDMRDPDKYEAYLRPILDRLKQIDGRGAVSIFTNKVDPTHPTLAKLLRDGVSLECHTIDHPCPCLQGGNFAARAAPTIGASTCWPRSLEVIRWRFVFRVVIR